MAQRPDNVTQNKKQKKRKQKMRVDFVGNSRTGRVRVETDTRLLVVQKFF